MVTPRLEIEGDLYLAVQEGGYANDEIRIKNVGGGHNEVSLDEAICETFAIPWAEVKPVGRVRIVIERLLEADQA